MSIPKDAVVAFDAAIASGDEAAARAVSVRWDADGDTPGKLFGQATRKRFRLEALATVSQPERAIVGAALVPAEPSAKKKIERLWLMTVRVDGDWKVAGVTQSPAIAALFLDGLLKPGEKLSDLPESPEAAEHVRNLLDPTSPHADGPTVRTEAAGASAIASARKVAGTVRHIVELGGGESRGPWVLLNEAEGGFALQGVSKFQSLSTLLEGLAVGYSLDEPEGKAMADEKGGISGESPEVKAALAKVFQDALSAFAAGAGKGADPKATEAFLGLFQAAIKQTGAAEASKEVEKPAPAESGPAEQSMGADSSDSEPIDLAAEREKRGIVPPSDLEQKIQENVRGALNDYVVDNVAHGADASGEITVNADFLKDHGPALFASVLQAFARSLIPEEIKIELPERSRPVDPAAAQPSAGNAPAGEATGPHVVPPPPGVKLKLDFNDIVNGVLSTINKKPTGPAGNSGEGEPG